MNITREKTMYRDETTISPNQCGTGWVVCPSDVDFEKFIQTSRLQSTVSIELDEGGVKNDVAVTKQAMDKLVYPIKQGLRGSKIVWQKINFHNQLLVIGVLQNDIENNPIKNESGESGDIRYDKFGSIGYLYNLPKKQITISTVSENSQYSKISINATNTSKTSVIEIKAAGSVLLNATKLLQATSNDEVAFYVSNTVESDKIMKLRYKLREGLTYNDEWNNSITVNSDGYSLTTDTKCKFVISEKDNSVNIANSNAKINVTDGNIILSIGEHTIHINSSGISLGKENISNERAILGNKLVTLLSEILTAISVLTVGTPSGPSTVPVNASQFIQFQTRLAELLSEVVSLE